MTLLPFLRRLFSAIAFYALALNPAAAGDPEIWERAAAVAGVNVRVIHGIALTESGRRWSDGLKRPWPWTLNSPRGPMFFSTKEQAVRALEGLLADGVTNIDVGYMQVNCGWHCSRVERPRDLLDPSTNLMVAAQILKEARSAAPTIADSVGIYHAGPRPDRKARADWYRDQVAAHIRRLQPPPAKNS